MTLGGFKRLRGHRESGEGARNHAPEKDREEFLPDTIGGTAMKLLDLLQRFFVPVVGFSVPLRRPLYTQVMRRLLR